MRVFFAVLLAILLASSTATAGILDASWTAPTTNTDGSPLTNLKEYRLYYALSPATPCPGSTFVTVTSPTPSPAPNTTVTRQLTGLTAGSSYNASVTAINLTGQESPCSTLASAVARPNPGIDITITGLTQGQQVSAATITVEAIPVGTTATRIDFSIINSVGTVVYSQVENLAAYCLGGNPNNSPCQPTDVSVFPRGNYTLRTVMTYSDGIFTKNIGFSLVSGSVPPPGTNLQLNFTP